MFFVSYFLNGGLFIFNTKLCLSVLLLLYINIHCNLFIVLYIFISFFHYSFIYILFC